jgi:hypothetical protein
MFLPKTSRRSLVKKVTLFLVTLLLAASCFAQNEGVSIGPNMVEVKVIRDGVVIYREINHNLKTTGGIDAIASQMANTSTQAASGNYLALSTDAGAPAAGDCASGSTTCTLTGEVSTSGLQRAQAAYTHTNGQATYTLTKTWTASGTVSNVQKAGVFNAASSGTMIFENTFTPVTLNNGDQIQLTWTITIS